MDTREKMVDLVKNSLRAYGKDLEKTVEPFEFIADFLISNGVTVQGWVPASDPPKKITNKVIVLCKNGYRGFGHYEDYKGERTWYNLESGKPFTDWDLEDCESYEVTHWQPMPQPPKGE